MSVDGLKKIASGAEGGAAITAQDVKAFIRANPSVVVDDPELLALIVPDATSEDGVIADMQRFAIDRLKHHMADLTRQRDATLNTIRANAVVTEKAQQAVLSILDARNFEHMVKVITRDIGPLIDVDRVVMCLEETDIDEEELATIEQIGVRILPECAVDAVLGEGANTHLQGDTHGSGMIFGAGARDVQSYALIRLAISPDTPPGLLALGSHSPDTFHAQQGVDLLEFIARVVERQVRAWLGLPAA